MNSGMFGIISGVHRTAQEDELNLIYFFFRKKLASVFLLTFKLLKVCFFSTK